MHLLGVDDVLNQDSVIGVGTQPILIGIGTVVILTFTLLLTPPTHMKQI